MNLKLKSKYQGHFSYILDLLNFFSEVIEIMGNNCIDAANLSQKINLTEENVLNFLSQH